MTGAMTMPEKMPAKATERMGRVGLIAEAVQLLSLEGIDGMSIGKLAERTGYSKAGIMAHFRSKREMILTLVEESVGIAREFFRERLKGAGTPSERLSRTLATYGEYWTSGVFEGGCLFLNLSVDAIEPADEIALALKRAARTFISDFATVVRVGQATGEFVKEADADAIAERIMALCLGCGWIYRMTGETEIFARMQPALDGILGEISRKKAQPAIAS